MAVLTVVKAPGGANVDPGLVAAANGDTAKNGRGRLCLFVQNTDSAPHTLTIAPVITVRPPEGIFPAMTVPNISKAFAAGENGFIGPIPNAYNDASNNVTMGWSAVTGIKVAAVEVE